MNCIIERERKLEAAHTTEVLVLGSGPAGIGAALSAARAGVKTMLIEKDGVLGGVSTSGLMSHWTGTVDSALYTELLKRACTEEGRSFDADCIYIHPEYLKLTYINMLEEAGVTVQLHTFVSDVAMENGTVKGVITESKSGREFIAAKVTIDCTGDGDAAFKAGVPFYIGRESDNKMQPMTLMFKVGGVDETRAVLLGSFESTYMTEKGELQALARQHLSAPMGHVLLYKSTQPGVVTCNMTNFTGVDGTNVEDLTRAQIECTKQMPKIVAFLREFVPGYERCTLLSGAAAVGVRETRHFKGLYTIDEHEIYAAKQFEDWVVKGAKFNFDIHNIEGAGLDKHGLQHGYKQEKGYTIPYGCLLPEGVDGLLLAGRCISGTHVAHSNFRVMPICLGMGEAAGIAAALAVQKGLPVKSVAPKDIQNRL